MSKTRGRPSILDELGITVDDLVKAYTRRGSLIAVAEEFHISSKTVQKYLRQAGQPITRGNPVNPYPWMRNRRSPVMLWFIEHPYATHCRSLDELAEKSGLPRRRIRRFLYSRKIAILEYIKTLGDLRELPGYMLDTAARKIPFGMLEDYTLEVDFYELTVTVKGVLRFGGAVTGSYSINEYRELWTVR